MRLTLALVRRGGPFVLFSCFLLLAGCGDSSGGNGTGGRLTGFFTGMPVSGLSYETPTMSGITGPDGDFEYAEGEIVRFFLGATTLGEIPGQEEVTPFDLAGIDPIVGSAIVFTRSPELNRVFNITTLLQTFDADGDHSNGIEITSEVAALFAGADADLENSVFGFRRDRAFRGALNRANATTLLDGYRAPVDPTHAAGNLYEALALAPPLYAIAHETNDMDFDGAIDTDVTVEYDAFGNVTRRVVVTGMSEQVTHISYEASSGLVTGSTSDNDGDGMPDAVRNHAYDMDGNEIEVFDDQDNDGTPEFYLEATYNEFGEQLTQGFDFDGDSIFDEAMTNTYDDRGNRIRSERDADGDGDVDQITTRIFNAQDQEIERLADSDGNGTVDVRTVNTYDAQGNVTRVETDSDTDGVFDSVVRREFDENGNQVRFEGDTNNDGTPDQISITTFNPDGTLAMQQIDNNGDGMFESVQTNTYDVQGNLIRSENDSDNDGTPDTTRISEYDDIGNRTALEEDTDGDGMSNRRLEFEYVPTGWGVYFND